MTQQPGTEPNAGFARPRRGRAGEGRQVDRQLNVRLPHEVMDEIDAAIDATAARGGPHDKTQFIALASLTLLQQLRLAHNDGRPFTR